MYRFAKLKIPDATKISRSFTIYWVANMENKK